MSDYSKTTDFTAKDALSTGNPLKVIKGAYFDTEFDNIATAVATKYDVNDLASQANAEAGTLNTVLMTPLRVQNWGDANGGIVGDLQALADPNADAFCLWDDSAGAAVLMQLATEGGLAISATPDLGIDISSLSNSIEGSALAATDLFLVDDGANGTNKKIAVQDLGMRIQTSQTTQSLVANDMNSIMKFTGTATLTIDTNATTDIPLGVPVVLIMDHATQELTVTANTSVTLESIYHPGGGSAASDKVMAGGMAVLVQTETDVWQLSGDIVDS